MKDVRTFGAVGDGVADDTTAIRQAFIGSGSVYFSAGVYRLCGSVSIPR